MLKNPAATIRLADPRHIEALAAVEMIADDEPHLRELDVVPAHGRRGIGTALLQAALALAAVFASEIARGLDPMNRVAMRYRRPDSA